MEDGAFAAVLAAVRSETDAALEQLLPPVQGVGLDPARARLHEAMRHAVLGPGKRFRAYLVVASADLFEVPRGHSLRVGAAVECLHAYSLVHDDLPAMDGDDLRRGRPTVHRAFGEAVAILAGDALQSLAFEILADPATHPLPAVRAGLVGELARAAGSAGMAGGQMMDLHPGQDEASIRAMQAGKTGAVIRFCCRAGGVLGGAEAISLAALDAYGGAIGLAYQIQDDLLDIGGDERQAGKRLGKDQEAGKVTLAGLRGVAGARQLAQELLAEAVSHLDPWGDRGAALGAASRFVMERSR